MSPRIDIPDIASSIARIPSLGMRVSRMSELSVVNTGVVSVEVWIMGFIIPSVFIPYPYACLNGYLVFSGLIHGRDSKLIN